MNEFDVIARYFNRKNTYHCSQVAECSIGDDCALLNIPPEKSLAVSTDTLVENVHFLRDINPYDLGYKALAVNLSDLAAMGADPVWLTLSLTIPRPNENWLAAFSQGLFELIDNYNMQLIGGDTTRGPLSITLSVYGLIPKGSSMKRDGAIIGDRIYVTGTLGNSAAGLDLHLRKDQDSLLCQNLLQHHLRPTPRVRQGKLLRGLASSAIDISDGLIADLRHIIKASDCGAIIYLENVPLSIELYNHFEYSQVLKWALSGGEDYELCFTIPDKKSSILKTMVDSKEFGMQLTCIGEIITDEKRLVLIHEGKEIQLDHEGFDHFTLTEESINET
jgi:thiamine-monophosphate kinase